MKFKDLQEQRVELFPDLHQIDIDLDRDGSYEIARQLLPALVKIAYTSLHYERQQHEKKHGPRSDEEDAYNFAFTRTALEDKVEEMMVHLADSIKELARHSNDIEKAITAASKDFKDPLEKD